MLKWLTARSAPPEPTLLTDDPLATISDRLHTRHQPVYLVTRVNPLFREGPTTTVDGPDLDDADSSRPTDTIGDRAADTVRDRPPDMESGRRVVPVRRLGGCLGWAGFDVLVVNGDYVSAVSVNLARAAPGSAAGPDVGSDAGPVTAAVSTGPAVVCDVMRNPAFVRSIRVTTVAARPAVCPRLAVTKNADYVVAIESRCAHVKTAPNVPPTGACPKITLDKNGNYVAGVSAGCSHVRQGATGWSNSPQPPTGWGPLFRLGAGAPVGAAPSAEVGHHQTAPGDSTLDSLVTSSLLLLTSSDPSPTATLSSAGSPPGSGSVVYEDQRWPQPQPQPQPQPEPEPERVLQEFSNVLVHSRSVAAMHRLSGELRSSAGSLASRGSSSAGRPDPETVTAPVAFLTRLWARTGLRTNGRRLLVGDPGGGGEARRACSASPTVGRRLTPSPPVPPRLPISFGWLQRVSSQPAAASSLAALTAVVVEPPPPADHLRRVHFSPGAQVDDGDDRTPADRQRLWNTYYSAEHAGYGALVASPLAAAEALQAAEVHDRKCSEFTLDAKGAAWLRCKAEERRRTRRLCRTLLVFLGLIVLLGVIIFISWYSSKGQHYFGAL